MAAFVVPGTASAQVVATGFAHTGANGVKTDR